MPDTVEVFQEAQDLAKALSKRLIVYKLMRLSLLEEERAHREADLRRRMEEIDREFDFRKRTIQADVESDLINIEMARLQGLTGAIKER